jgi:hypothetical protein
MSVTEEMIKAVDAWEYEYCPIKNPNNDYGWNGLMFETFDEDFDFVKQQPDMNVWTWVDGDDGTYIITGMAHINAIGYFVTKNPWHAHIEIQVDTYEED